MVGRVGYKHSAETKQKIAEAKMGELNPNFRGKTMTADVRRKISDTQRGRKHSVEWCQAISAAKKGMAPHRPGYKHSEETKRKIGESNSRALLGNTLSEETKQKIALFWSRFPKPETTLETAMYEFLGNSGISFKKQVRFGRYIVDAYLPKHHLAFESDGSYWHTLTEKYRPNYYAKRDGYLLERFNLPVVRLSESDLSQIFETKEGITNGRS